MLTSIALAAAVAAQSGVQWTPLKAPEPKSKVAAPRPAPPQAPAAQSAGTSAPQPGQTVSTQAVPAQSAPAIGGRLDLTCFGAGTANKHATTTVESDSDFSGMIDGDIVSGSVSGSSTITSAKQQAFRDQVDIRLFAGDDRIRMPRTMLPLIRGGKEGWFKLRNVVADARSIRASAAVNMLNNPKVHIDRVTGTISISGKAGDYVGQCEAIEASAPAKF